MASPILLTLHTSASLAYGSLEFPDDTNTVNAKELLYSTTSTWIVCFFVGEVGLAFHVASWFPCSVFRSTTDPMLLLLLLHRLVCFASLRPFLGPNSRFIFGAVVTLPYYLTAHSSS